MSLNQLDGEIMKVYTINAFVIKVMDIVRNKVYYLKDFIHDELRYPQCLTEAVTEDASQAMDFGSHERAEKELDRMFMDSVFARTDTSIKIEIIVQKRVDWNNVFGGRPSDHKLN